MKRWNCKVNERIENKNIDEFIEGVIQLGKRLDLSISHQDVHGSFVIERFSEKNASWLREASDDT